MKLLGADVETDLIGPGNLTPELICVSLALPNGETYLYDHERGTSAIEYALDDPEYILVLHNAPFDLADMGAFRPHLIPKIFAAYAEGRIRCTQTRQELLDIADGLGVKLDETDENADARKVIIWRTNRFTGEPLKSGRSLADLELYFYNEDRSAAKTDPEAWRLRYRELRGVEPRDYPPAARQYAIDDAVGALRVLFAQGGPELQTNELEQLQRAWCLHLLSCTGLRTNPERVAKLAAFVEPEYRRQREQLLVEGFYRIQHLRPAEIRDGKQQECVDAKGRPAYYVKNIAFIQDRVAAAYRALGARVPMSPPSGKFPTGQIKTDRDTLVNSDDELLEVLGGGGTIGTVHNTFLPTLRNGTAAAINTKFRLLATGRISSAEPNCNNIPRSFWTDAQRKEIIEEAREYHQAGDLLLAQQRLDLLDLDVRACFEPRPGYYYASVDYDCAELRALGQVCLWLFGKSAFAEFFQREPDGDPHLALAADLLGITYEEAKRRKKAGDQQIKDMRQACKAYNFGFPGGLGPDKFVDLARKQYGVHVKRSEAVRRKEQWMRRWPEMRHYFDYMSRLVANGPTSIMQMRPGYRKGEQGPRLRPHRVRGNVGYCDGLNTLFQGLIADAASHALWRVSNECYVDQGTALYGSRPVVFLYDEIICEVPIATAHEAAHRLRDVMVEAAQEWIPDVPMTASPALMTEWRKSAEPVYRDGRLVPWQPKRVTLDDLARMAA